MTGKSLEREFRQGNHAQEYLRQRQARRAAAALGGTGEMLVGRNEVDMTQAVNRVLHHRNQQKWQKMLGDVRVMGRNRDRRRVKDRDGGGEFTLQVHPTSYHYWGQRLGYECWQDAQFVREYKRDNDYARVTSHSDQPKVGWTPGQEAASGYLKRNHKVQLKA